MPPRLPPAAGWFDLPTLLAGGQTPRVRESNGAVTLTIPSIVDHEVIAIDL